MKIIIQSFGYKKSGIPANSNLVFDVRGLPNPYDVPELKELNGQDFRVGEWLLQFDSTHREAIAILNTIYTMATFHNKDTLVVSIGCYGGKHRSQFMVEYIGMKIRKYDVETRHLEI